jgi:hypothetical protein
MGHAYSFSASPESKKVISWSRLSDVLNMRIAWDLIIYLLNVLINDFGEVDEAMFEGVARQWELIFCILGIDKSNFHDVV